MPVKMGTQAVSSSLSLVAARNNWKEKKSEEKSFRSLVEDSSDGNNRRASREIQCTSVFAECTNPMAHSEGERKRQPVFHVSWRKICLYFSVMCSQRKREKVAVGVVAVSVAQSYRHRKSREKESFRKDDGEKCANRRTRRARATPNQKKESNFSLRCLRRIRRRFFFHSSRAHQ